MNTVLSGLTYPISRREQSQHVSELRSLEGDDVSVLCSQLVFTAPKWPENLFLQVEKKGIFWLHFANIIVVL